MAINMIRLFGLRILRNWSTVFHYVGKISVPVILCTTSEPMAGVQVIIVGADIFFSDYGGRRRNSAAGLRVTDAESEGPFAETDVADRDPEVRRNKEGSFIDLWLADLDAPMVGRNLLAEETYSWFVSDLEGHHAFCDTWYATSLTFANSVAREVTRASVDSH
jgi:hypothetical protein